MFASRSAPSAALFLALVLAFASPAAAVTVPAQFVVENAVTNSTFNVPVGMAFLPDGRFLVAEKQGRVLMVKNGLQQAAVVFSNQNEVLDNTDRGFLGVAVDPNYFVNHFVYFLYTVDPDSNGVDDNLYGFGRLTRYRMRTTGDTNTVDPTTRTVLMGTDWRHGPTILSNSHTIGALRWGRDGSLLVSSGDGADFNGMDAGGRQPTGFGPGKTDPYEDIGAFRAQDITSLNGKILRMNPLTGHGYASNPYATSDLNSNQSKVYLYGVRNTFRFGVRPGTGSTDTTTGFPGQVAMGDVGWDTWEELNISTAPGQNFGWPCIEGPFPAGAYQAATPAHNDCSSVGTPSNPTGYTYPPSYWHHTTPSLSNPEGVMGNASVGGVFYTDSLYPSAYRTRYFFGDYVGSFVRVATFDSNGLLISNDPFGDNMDNPVDFARNPLDGNVYYVSITTEQVRRIRWTGTTGGNAAPIAQALATPSSGGVPLNVSFSSAGTYDPDNNTLTYAWNFGDGGTSSAQNPSHTYVAPGAYIATLTVTDSRGGVGTRNVSISVGSGSVFPTTAVLDDFNRPNGPIGGAWVNQTSALSIVSNTMRETGLTATTVWSGQEFGADQEAYITMQTITPGAEEVNLMLKVQGLSWSDGHIEVRYDDNPGRVRVGTYSPALGWQAWGEVNPLTFSPGDRFGARAFASGLVEVFKNGVVQGQVSVLGWPFAANGGYVGLTITGANATIFDDFGGGDWVPQPPVPVVQVLSPNGGENWVGGSSHTVTWLATDDIGVTSVDVDFKDGATAPWIPIAINLSNSGSFTWFVHNMPTTAARVRVRAHDLSGNVGADSSDANFTISATPGGIVPTTLRDFFQPGTQPLRGGDFVSSSTCNQCHSGYDSAVEPGFNFKGVMMGQAARDPLFYACLAVAEQDAPSSGDLCIRCHSPGAWLSGKSQPTSGANIDALGRDGVNCDFCHRMVDPIYQPGVSPVEDLAVLNGMLPAHVPTTYGNGQYVVDSDTRRRGPFADAAAPHSFLQSPFHTKSEMCATCHDVSNPVFDRTGPSDYTPGPLNAAAPAIAVNSLMPLERTYSEWLNSAYPAGVYAPDFAGNAPGGIVSDCQGCHMRQVTGRGCNDVNAPVRNDLPVHDLTGGNAFMPGVIGTLYPAETDTAALNNSANRARATLQKAALLDVTVAAEGDSFRASVKVTNRTGHKLPTGYPEGRRMWISVVARDENGAVVYQSGHYDGATGVLTEDADARVYEAHLGISPALASAIGLAHGPSFHFALNDTLYKDNRIPPLGFTNAAFQTFGGAPVDPTMPAPRYADGQNWDTATYPLPGSARSVAATLYYQTTSKEYVEFLAAQNTTNGAGATLLNAWTNNGRGAPVPMVGDSATIEIVGTGDPVARPLAFRVLQNPFRGTLDLSLSLPRASDVTLEVLDVTGRLVRRTPYGRLAASEHHLRWDGHDASGGSAGPGLYWVVARVDDRRLVKTVVRLR